MAISKTDYNGILTVCDNAANATEIVEILWRCEAAFEGADFQRLAKSIAVIAVSRFGGQWKEAVREAVT